MRNEEIIINEIIERIFELKKIKNQKYNIEKDTEVFNNLFNNNKKLNISWNYKTGDPKINFNIVFVNDDYHKDVMTPTFNSNSILDSLKK